VVRFFLRLAVVGLSAVLERFSTRKRYAQTAFTGLPMHFSVAPMMEWTDRHCRAFHRVLSKKAVLYTEMVTADAVRFGPKERLLGWSPTAEGEVILQLGGSDPLALAQAAKIGEDFGYHGINLNVGCPSDRVQSGRFGACLMREPALVAECMAAMMGSVSIPVSVKHRLGVDEQDPEQSLFNFVETVAGAGVREFTVHARKAWLKGLSPKENRDVPPLDYAIVHRLKAAYPNLGIALNGGLETLEQCTQVAAGLDGVMMGRTAYHQPAVLGAVDRWLDGRSDVVGVDEAHQTYRAYVAKQLENGTPLIAITRHMLGLSHGLRGARSYRRILSEAARQPGAGLDVYDAALAALDQTLASVAA
jgi:tRNA-dihydrouridine synthase A